MPIKKFTRFAVEDAAKMSKAELTAYIKQNARTANDRMARLRKAGRDYKSYAYGVADQWLQEHKRKTFGVTSKMNRNQLVSMVTALNAFLSSGTSTITGVKESEMKRYQTAVAHGYQGTFQQFVDMVEEVFKSSNALAGYGSKTKYEMLIAGRGDEYLKIANDEIYRMSTTPGQEHLKAVEINKATLKKCGVKDEKS